MSDTILVTGASGQLGRLVLHHLIETQGLPAERIIAATRDPAKLTELEARGVAVRKADFDDPASLDAAFAGVGKLLIISTDAVDKPGRRIRQHKAAIDAAVRAGVGRIAYTSMPNPQPGNPVLFAPDHYSAEQAIKESGLPYTIFRNSWYQENLFMNLPQVLSSSKWFTSTGAGKLAHVSRDDVAAAIAAALADTEGDSVTYTLTGATARTIDEIATLASDVLGKPIEVVHISDEALLEGMKAAGVPEAFAPLLVSFDANTRNGTISDVTDEVEKLSGRKPRELKTFFEANKTTLAA